MKGGVMAGDVRRFGGVGDACDEVLCCRQLDGPVCRVQRDTALGDASDEGAFESSCLSEARHASACARLGPLIHQETCTIPASCLTTAPTYHASHAPSPLGCSVSSTRPALHLH
jgi:hypothetical protein